MNGVRPSPSGRARRRGARSAKAVTIARDNETRRALNRAARDHQRASARLATSTKFAPNTTDSTVRIRSSGASVDSYATSSPNARCGTRPRGGKRDTRSRPLPPGLRRP
jgi:hypothetical protein